MNRDRRASFAWLVINLMLLSSAVAETPRRIVQSQPEGRYAKTDIGYMIPYSVSIPGSDAGFEMVPVPGGEWHLESNDPSAPMLKVRVEPFWIGKYEVTWKEFFEYMASHQQFRLQRVANATDDSVDAVTSPTALYSPELVLEYARTDDFPACGMSQFSARQYTKWLSLLLDDRYRLPTEAEWQFACNNGIDGPVRPIPPDLAQEVAVYAKEENSQPRQVGSRKPNALGIHDMLGNVSEWVLDAGEPDPSMFDGKIKSVFASIRWPTTRFGHVAIGGNFSDQLIDCTPSRRWLSEEKWWDEDPCLPQSPWWLASDFYSTKIGFRIVRPLKNGTGLEWEKFWEADSEELRNDIEMSIKEGRGVSGNPLKGNRPRRQRISPPR